MKMGLIYIILGFFLGVMTTFVFNGAHAQGTRAVVVHPNGSVDIDWRSIPMCREPICLAVAAARRAC